MERALYHIQRLQQIFVDRSVKQQENLFYRAVTQQESSDISLNDWKMVTNIGSPLIGHIENNRRASKRIYPFIVETKNNYVAQLIFSNYFMFLYP